MRRRTGCWTLPATGRARRDCAGDGRLAVPSARSLTENSVTGMSQSGPHDGSRTAGNRPGGNRSRNGPSGDSRSLRRHLARPQKARPRKARPRKARPRKARPRKTRLRKTRLRKTRPRTPYPGTGSHRPENTSPSRSGSFAEIPFMIASIRPATATACGPGGWPQSPAFPGIARRTGRAMRSTPLCRDRRPLIRRGPSRLRRLARRFCHIRRPVHRSRLYRRGIRLTTAASCRAIHPVRRRPGPGDRQPAGPAAADAPPGPAAARPAALRPGEVARTPPRYVPSPGPDAGPQAQPARRPDSPPEPVRLRSWSRRSRAPRCRQSLRLMPGSISSRRRAR